ncbi:MAG: hypothetical protein ACL93V_00615 [Candidatus Electrothrix sp. YB6]
MGAAYELYRKGKAIGCVIDPLTNPEQEISPTCEPDLKEFISAIKVKDAKVKNSMICYKYKTLNFKQDSNSINNDK